MLICHEVYETTEGVERRMKIYVRERQKVGEGVKQPMFRVVAITGGEIQIQAIHFRKFEIEQIAKDVKAEVVYLEEIPDEEKKKRH
jgi:hypothetical protein